MTPSVLTLPIKEEETLLTPIATPALRIIKIGMETTELEALDWKENHQNTLTAIEAKPSTSSPPSNGS